MSITVSAGDSLSSLAMQYGIGLQELEAANSQIENFDLVY